MAADQRATSDEAMTGSRVENVQHAVSQGLNRIRGRLNEGVESSRDVIRENPINSVLVAAGVGALVGFLLGRTCTNK